MSNHAKGETPDKGAIFQDLLEIISGMNSGWGADFDESITPDTRLGADLRLKSLDFVRLITIIRKRYQKSDLPFQDLLVSDNGSMLNDIQVSYLVDFLARHLNGNPG